jgi:hypothetical protein
VTNYFIKCAALVHYKVFSKKKLASSGSGRQPNNRQRMKKIPMFEFPVLSIARITSVLPSCPHIQSLPPSAFRLPPSAIPQAQAVKLPLHKEQRPPTARHVGR